MNKQSLLIGGIILSAVIMVGYALLQPTSDVDMIKESLAKKHDLSTENMEVNITERIDNYASGHVQFDVNQPAGASVWYGVKENDSWTIAFDSNGFPLCSEIEPYDFPAELLESCIDDETEDLIQR